MYPLRRRAIRALEGNLKNQDPRMSNFYGGIRNAEH